MKFLKQVKLSYDQKNLVIGRLSGDKKLLTKGMRGFS